VLAPRAGELFVGKSQFGNMRMRPVTSACHVLEPINESRPCDSDSWKGSYEPRLPSAWRSFQELASQRRVPTIDDGESLLGRPPHEDESGQELSRAAARGRRGGTPVPRFTINAAIVEREVASHPNLIPHAINALEIGPLSRPLPHATLQSGDCSISRRKPHDRQLSHQSTMTHEKSALLARVLLSQPIVSIGLLPSARPCRRMKADDHQA
jgi:hypothetical protein